MTTYQHLLAAVDLTDESNHVLEQTALLASTLGAKVSIVHVLEPLSFAYGGDIPMDLTELQENLVVEARKHLEKVAQACRLADATQYVIVGHTQTEVHALATEQNVDLIVTGSHGRHGLALLLGSTANAILHGAECDVLAVRVGKSN